MITGPIIEIFSKIIHNLDLILLSCFIIILLGGDGCAVVVSSYGGDNQPPYGWKPLTEPSGVEPRIELAPLNPRPGPPKDKLILEPYVKPGPNSELKPKMGDGPSKGKVEGYLTTA